jgi:gliding motility-associated-like protein
MPKNILNNGSYSYNFCFRATKLQKKMRKFLLFSLILHKLSLRKMKFRQIIALLCLLALPVTAFCTLSPKAVYYDNKGNELSSTDEFTAEAPLHVQFYANATDLNAGATLEWRFRHTGSDGESVITRYGDETEFDFTASGLTVVRVYERLDDELVDSAEIRVTISESFLNMPNAFSPNDDGVNDIYRAKQPDGYKSIVEFHAYIFNRWGQKLFEWTDISKGWDGTYNGSPVKDGVYFVLVKARGADGRDYNIRRDITLMRRKNDFTTNSTNP